MKQKTILVTGCAGFIGMHVAKELLKRGDKVIGIDNLGNYYSPKLKEARLEILKEYSEFEFYKQDLEDGIDIAKNEKIDIICHLAAQAGVRYSIENPLSYESSNSLGTLQVFEFARKHKIKDIVFASSSSVYGNVKETPFTEDMDVTKPISLYAATKVSNEAYAYTYHHLYGIRMTGLRFFTVYGPFGRPDMALFLFTKKILDGEQIQVFNNGDLKRDFTYIDDITDGVIKAIDKSSVHEFEIFNLARGEMVQLLDFVREIEKATQKDANITYLPMQPGDVFITSGNVAKAKEKLGYNPQTSVSEGIKKFVEWYKKYYGK